MLNVDLKGKTAQEDIKSIHSNPNNSSCHFLFDTFLKSGNSQGLPICKGGNLYLQVEFMSG